MQTDQRELVLRSASGPTSSRRVCLAEHEQVSAVCRWRCYGRGGTRGFGVGSDGILSVGLPGLAAAIRKAPNPRQLEAAVAARTREIDEQRRKENQKRY